jgi:antitoxin component YwqK of YwqJK toxin-antitoxin module
MKHLLISLVLFSSLQKASAYGVGYEACGLEDAEKKRCEVKSVDGKKEGKEICRALDNREVILLETQYQNGNLNGPLICRDFTNTIYLQTTYLNGKLHGQHLDYSKSRHWKNIKEAWMVKYFENGQQVGMEFFADSNHKVLEIMPSCWDNGSSGRNFEVCLGMKYGKYDEAIKKHLETEITKLHKEMNRDIDEKYRNGKPKFKAKLVAGRYEGESIRYYETGAVKSKTQYRNGDPEKIEEFFAEGQPKMISLFKNGKLEKLEEFFQNTKLATIINVTHEKNFRKEKIERFNDKGFRESEYTMVYEGPYDSYGQLDGPYRSYSRDGQLYFDANYKMGKLDGKVVTIVLNRKEEELYNNGQLLEKTIYELGSGLPIEKIEYMKDGSEKSRTKLNTKSI